MFKVPIVVTLYSCLLINLLCIFEETVTKDETKPKRAKRGAVYPHFIPISHLIKYSFFCPIFNMQCLYFVQARRKHPLPKMVGKLVKQIYPLMKGRFFSC